MSLPQSLLEAILLDQGVEPDQQLTEFGQTAFAHLEAAVMGAFDDLEPGDERIGLQIKVCQFVDFSDLFAGCDLISTAFSNSDPDMSWGNNNRTMASREAMQTAIDNLEYDKDFVEGSESDWDAQLESVESRIASLPYDVYIDLEN